MSEGPARGGPSARFEEGRRGSSGLAEAFVLWLLFGIVAVATFVTYTHTPVRELYHVSTGGTAAGMRAVLGFAGFPAGLMALAVLPLVLDRARGRVVRNWALIAAGLAATLFLPGALGDARIDARPANVFAAAGVALVLFLTIVAARTGGFGSPWRRGPGDRLRLLLAISGSPSGRSRGLTKASFRGSRPYGAVV